MGFNVDNLFGITAQNEQKRKLDEINAQTKKIYEDIEAARLAELGGAVAQTDAKTKGYVNTRTLLASSLDTQPEDEEKKSPASPKRRKTLLGGLE